LINVADKLLDARGLNCPLPILKAKKAIADVQGGGTLEVLATDPGSVPDFKAFCEAGRHTLVEQTETGGVYRFLIRRAA
jgi:tRNA 2-thiouridine synthesizing protein A